MQYVLTQEELSDLQAKAKSGARAESNITSLMPFIRKTVSCRTTSGRPMSYCDDCPLADTVGDVPGSFTNHGNCILGHYKEFSK